MTDTDRVFEITNVQHDKGALEFVLSGTREYGLDKSVANAIRRTLLNDIPTVALEVDEDVKQDITMVKNDTALHNEMMMFKFDIHRDGCHIKIYPRRPVFTNFDD